MKTTFIWLIFVLCAVGILFLMHQDPGYVLIAYHHTTLEMTLWFASIALFVGLFLLRFVWGAFFGVLSIPMLLRRNQNKRTLIKGQQALERGLVDLVLGNYKEAGQTLKKGAKYQRNPLLNYLGGAYALSAQDDQEACFALLDKAVTKLPEDKNAIVLMQIQLLVVNQCFAKALALLENLDKKIKHQSLSIKLYMQCYIGLGEWRQANDLLSTLVKTKILSLKQLESIKQTLIIGTLASYPVGELSGYWVSLSRQEKTNEAFIWLLADRYVDEQAFEEAVTLITHELKRQFSQELWELLASCVESAPKAILHFCQKQLKQHANKAVIYYCAALATLALGDLNEAKALLTQANGIEVTEEALLTLADIYQQQGLNTELNAACLQLLNIAATDKEAK